MNSNGLMTTLEVDMKDWKTTITPVAALIVAGLAKYGLDVPIEIVLGIIGLGMIVMGYFTKDRNKPDDAQSRENT